MARLRYCPRRTAALLPLSLAFLLFLAPPVPAAAEDATDWPQLRGPGRDGKSPETGLLHQWPQGGPAVLWRTAIGEGYSGVAAAAGKAYTLFNAGEKEVLAAFDAVTGKELWRTPMGAALSTEMGNGPRSTPVVAGGTVVAVGSDAVLMALAAADGKAKWSVNLVERFGSRMPQWGLSSTPLVDGDLVLMEIGGEKAAFAAFDLATGETRWTAFESRMGYSSPVILEVGGVRQYVFVPSAAPKVVALRTDGSVYWTYDWHGGTLAMPVVVDDDKIFVSASNDIGGALIQIRQEGDSAVVQELWKNREMKNHFSSSVAYEGNLYGFDNGTLKCLDAASGERKWVHRGLGKGSLIIADGLLIVLSENGKLMLAPASSAGFKPTGSIQVLSGKTWTSPSLADGRLYLRDFQDLVALDIRQREGEGS